MQLAGLDSNFNGIAGSLYICEENYTECKFYANKINNMQNVTYIRILPSSGEPNNCKLNKHKRDGIYVTFCLDFNNKMIPNTLDFGNNFALMIDKKCNLCYSKYFQFIKFVILLIM